MVAISYTLILTIYHDIILFPTLLSCHFIHIRFHDPCKWSLNSRTYSVEATGQLTGTDLLLAHFGENISSLLTFALL
jgi:hypothetical protein